MAKSKSGGTRSYIRGKIGADVYSIGKDGKGAKQQVVRSLAEVVSNPQTEAQMKGRMIMSTVMQAVSALAPIIDHSFDNRPTGQPSISEFISRNYALVKADVAAHPSASNVFGLNKYQEKGAKGGQYVISYGVVPTPSAIAASAAEDLPTITINLGGANKTVADLLDVTGLSKGDYITLVSIAANGGGLQYGRVYISESAADATVISSETIGEIFDIESNFSVGVVLDGNNLIIQGGAYCASCGCILSRKNNEGWEHNTATMDVVASPTYTAEVALPTYPQGTARFLNGGDI